MAIIVPILLSYTGAAAAIGTAVGISATAVTAIASVAFQVTGLNNKINKAASKVFGEDLVMIANIAGAVYGAVNGGFGGGGADAAAAATDASSAMAVNGLDAADNVFNAAGGLVSDGFSALSSTSDASSLLATNGLDMADNTFNLANQAAGGKLASDGVGIAAATPTSTQGVDLMKGTQVTGTDTKEIAEVSRTADLSGASRPAAAAPAASAPAASPVAPAATSANAAGAKAAAQAAAKEAGMSAFDSAAKSAVTAAKAAPEAGSFFDRLGKMATSEKGMGAIVQGVGAGLTSAANSKAQKEQLEFAKKKYHSTSGIRVA
ncbi:hypothetical protein PMI14_05315 [Acidovorax sp. CF316]|uniref:hypothetical protein n=1 Tax=Acidovorax sp. CF316 TaxID=1144317 RepID=UPI00026BD028|nr:hypothetical protein [Acidovorax sp. CF316]EJE50110.1 hypothetical protein PMI14_05315 [Acidovorax sp. CF316]